MFMDREGEVDQDMDMVQKNWEAMGMTLQYAISRTRDREKWRKSIMELP